MAQVQVKKLSIRHDLILDFILANPLLSYQQVAVQFGVTPAWLSVVVHSDAFQRRLKQRQDEIFTGGVLNPLSSKLSAAADLTIEKYMEKVGTFDNDQLIAGADKLLNRLGFGGGPKGATIVKGDMYQQVNHHHVSPQIVEEARGKIGSSSHQMGKAYKCAALLYKTTTERTETEGS